MFDLHDLPDQATLDRFRDNYPGLDDSALLCFLELLRVASDVFAAHEASMARFGLSSRRFYVLVLLLRNTAGLGVSQLAHGTGVSCATMSGVVDTLERDGLVRREDDAKDRRRWVVRATDAGLDLLGRVLPGHFDSIKRLMAGLGEGQREALRGLLGQVAQGLGAWRDAAIQERQQGEQCNDA